MVKYKELYLKEKKEKEELKEIHEHTKINLKKVRAEGGEESLKIKALKLDMERIKLSRDLLMLGLNKGDYIFLIAKRRDGKKYTYSGFVTKETLHHITLLIHDTKRNAGYKYLIKKEETNDIKLFDGDRNATIKYKDLLELWKNQNK